MSTSAEQMRTWSGPAILSFGFRPFFLGGTIWAVLAMGLWIGMLSGIDIVSTHLDPVSWHAHEFIFGYLGVIVAGFLLTAVPNWTGRLPIVGWPLAGLVSLWLAGRLAVGFSNLLPALAVAMIDLAMPVALAVALAREILAGNNRRNLQVLFLLSALIVGNAVFHWELYQGWPAAEGFGIRIGLGTGIMLIGLIGGRIIPSFTRNWLVRRGATVLPTPMGPFDFLVLGVLLFAITLWIIQPESTYSGAALILAGILNLARLFRWAGYHTFAEPLVWVLHMGYAFVPLGALVMGAATFTDNVLITQAAQHIWMAGAIGLMTLAVMTRATLGHTGRKLEADTPTVAIYLMLLLSVACRVLSGGVAEMSAVLNLAAGLCWMGAFAGFVIHYGPMLLSPRQHGKTDPV